MASGSMDAGTAGPLGHGKEPQLAHGSRSERGRRRRVRQKARKRLRGNVDEVNLQRRVAQLEARADVHWQMLRDGLSGCRVAVDQDRMEVIGFKIDVRAEIERLGEWMRAELARMCNNEIQAEEVVRAAEEMHGDVGAETQEGREQATPEETEEMEQKQQDEEQLVGCDGMECDVSGTERDEGTQVSVQAVEPEGVVVEEIDAAVVVHREKIVHRDSAGRELTGSEYKAQVEEYVREQKRVQRRESKARKKRMQAMWKQCGRPLVDASAGIT